MKKIFEKKSPSENTEKTEREDSVAKLQKIERGPFGGKKLKKSRTVPKQI